MMAVFDDPGEELDWMEDELWEEEEEYGEEPSGPKPFFPKRRRSRAEKVSDQQALFVEKGRRKKENRGLKLLAFLEAAAILAVIWWWIKWLY